MPLLQGARPVLRGLSLHQMRRRAAPENPTLVRLPFLEGLRGLAALYVVLSHICSMADPSRLASKPSQAPEWLQALMAPFQFGHLAVAAFIVLSGFCLQLSLFSNADGRPGPLKKWFARRAKRILPPYYGALAFSIVVALTVTAKQTGYPFQVYLPVTTENVLAHVFLIHNFSLDWMYKINGVLWSIAIEAQLYLLFPLLVASVFKVGRWPTLLVSVAAAAMILLWVPNAPKLYPWYLPLFVLGMISAHVAYRPNLRTGTRPWISAVVTVAGFVAAGYASSLGQPLYVCDSLLGVGVAALCYLLTVTEEGWICKSLAYRPMVGLGAFSYSLYLMHHPIQQVVYAHRPSGVEGPEPLFWYLLLFGLPVILIGTWLFSLVFEKPFVTRRPAQKESLRNGLVPVELPLKTYMPPQEEVPIVEESKLVEVG
jgi:peptidoglycan/LPS O-acetylase OafA/YrhL